MHAFDEEVLQCFLDNQLQLFPEPVASTREEAEEFLTECMAQVAASAKEVEAYFEEEGIDIGEGSLIEASEVFAVGDGRYLIVNG